MKKSIEAIHHRFKKSAWMKTDLKKKKKICQLHIIPAHDSS